ncbi:hypothetical protein ACEPPN_010791 [Leptodophora sp. 'Broadleaf-Isolate-01']
MDSNSPPEPQYPMRKRRRHSSISATRSTPTETASPVRTELGHMRSDVTGSTSFVGSGSGIYFVRTVRSALARNISWDADAIDTEMVPGEDDRIEARRESSPNAKYLWRPEEVGFTSPGQGQLEALVPVAFADLVQWSQSYFNLWHPPFPFLHAPSVLVLFEKLATHGISHLSMTESLIIRSVLSISLADRRQMPRKNQSSVPAHLIFNTIDDAVSCLSPILMKSPTISGLQAALSVQVFLISILRLNTASRFGGLIVRIAFHLGIHRCPARYAQFALAEEDIRRRLFWSIYSLERFLAQSLGLPIDLKDADIDVCPPFAELHVGSHKVRNDQGQPPDQRLFLLPTFLARISKIKGLILELRHVSVNHRVADPDEVAHIEAEISKWWNEVRDFIDPASLDDDNLGSPDNMGPKNSLQPAHRLLLIVQKHESVILLNRPVITSGHNNYAVMAAMQKCIGASKTIVSTVYQYIQDSRKEDDSLDGRINNPLFWPGFTCGLILLYAASHDCYSVETAQREATRCVKILENLALRGVFWPSTCAAAIKDLQQALRMKTGNHPSINGEVENPATARSEPLTSSFQAWPLNPQSSLDDVTSSSPNPTPRPNFQSQPWRTLSGLQSNLAPNAAPELQIMAESELQRNRRSGLPQNDPSFTNLSGMNGLLPRDDHFDDFNNFGDIFQLMDVPYYLSEQSYEMANLNNA